VSGARINRRTATRGTLNDLKQTVMSQCIFIIFACIYLRHLFLHHSRCWYISRAMYQQFIGTKNFAKFCHFFF